MFAFSAVAFFRLATASATRAATSSLENPSNVMSSSRESALNRLISAFHVAEASSAGDAFS